MSCTVCGSSANCGCGTVNTCSGCSSNNCNSVNCNTGCSSSNSCSGNTVPATPQPFYACAPACKEDNKQKIFITHYSTTVKVVSSWNVPACGGSATVSVPGLTSVVIGSYLWNEQFGYFEITAYDSGLQQVTIVNNCNEGNAAAGTNVPACTLFVNTSPPAEEADSNTPCVAVSFTAPAVSACLDITLTNTTGITAGDTIQIGSGFYRVAAVKPNNIINICNDGEGITPGTSVIATDAAGNFQYCLQIISTSPCDRDVVESGAVVTCSEDGQVTTLEVPEDGWILSGAASSQDNSVEAAPLGLTPFCTRLSAQLSIVNGTANYTLTVYDSSGFTIGDIIQIAGYPDNTGEPAVRITITGIPGANSVTGTMSPTPAASVVIPVDTLICRIGCCELLSNEIEDVLCTSYHKIVEIDVQTFTEPVTLDGDGYFAVTIEPSFAVENLPNLNCPDVQYFVKAHLSIASLADFGMVPADLSELGYIYHEIEADWVPDSVPGPGRTSGKIVYSDSIGDTRAVGGFPANPNATFNQLISVGPNFTMSYHQADVVASAVQASTGGVMTLSLYYKTLVGDFEDAGLAYFDEMRFMVSGWIEIYTIEL
jgi:hypothetical protein